MTAVMQALYWRLPRSQQAPLPPSQITSRLTEGTGVDNHLDQRQHVGLTLLAHFGYGAAAGSLYAPLARLLPGPALLRGALFGLFVWTGSYLGLLPALGILPPATRHPPHRNALMIGAHLVWGGALALLAAQAEVPET
jgi:putative membrane protein